MISLGSAEEKLILNMFDINNDGLKDGGIGIIPDAISDAYDQGLFSDDEQEDQNDQLNDYEQDDF